MTDRVPDLEFIRVEVHERYAVLTLNRPEKRNALSLRLQENLRAALDYLRDKAAVIVVTGAGPAFCAGVDLKESAALVESGSPVKLGRVWFETLDLIRRHPAIFIAAVNGFALGGGLTLVNTCELAIASSEATFGMPELGFGEFPGLAGATTLKSVLPKHAAQMILTADRLTAEQARASGIVNAVIAPDELVKTAEALAQSIARHDATTLRVSKRALWELREMPWTASIERGMWLSTLSRGEAPE